MSILYKDNCTLQKQNHTT